MSFRVVLTSSLLAAASLMFSPGCSQEKGEPQATAEVERRVQAHASSDASGDTSSAAAAGRDATASSSAAASYAPAPARR